MTATATHDTGAPLSMRQALNGTVHTPALLTCPPGHTVPASGHCV